MEQLVTAFEINRMHKFVERHGPGLYAVRFEATGIASAVFICKPSHDIPEENVSDYGSW